MVCYSCGGSTSVVNSRFKNRSARVWRRRLCNDCGTLFTTIEGVLYKDVAVVKDSSGKLAPFSRDSLFVSILSSLSHRRSPVDDAGDITATIIAKLFKNGFKSPLNTSQIRQTALITLNRFDKTAAVYYDAH